MEQDNNREAQSPLVESLKVELKRILESDESNDEKEAAYLSVLSTCEEQNRNSKFMAITTNSQMAVIRGETFNRLRSLVTQKMGRRWIPYIKEKFPTNIIRNVQHWTRIAGAAHCHKYLPGLGEARVLRLLSKVEGRSGEDPINDYLREHGVEYDSSVVPVPQEVKQAIDRLIFKPRSRPVAPSKMMFAEVWAIFADKLEEAIKSEEVTEIDEDEITSLIDKLEALRDKA